MLRRSLVGCFVDSVPEFGRQMGPCIAVQPLSRFNSSSVYNSVFLAPPYSCMALFDCVTSFRFMSYLRSDFPWDAEPLADFKDLSTAVYVHG